MPVAESYYFWPGWCFQPMPEIWTGNHHFICLTVNTKLSSETTNIQNTLVNIGQSLIICSPKTDNFREGDSPHLQTNPKLVSPWLYSLLQLTFFRYIPILFDFYPPLFFDTACSNRHTVDRVKKYSVKMDLCNDGIVFALMFPKRSSWWPEIMTCTCRHLWTCNSLIATAWNFTLFCRYAVRRLQPLPMTSLPSLASAVMSCTGPYTPS